MGRVYLQCARATNDIPCAPYDPSTTSRHFGAKTKIVPTVIVS